MTTLPGDGSRRRKELRELDDEIEAHLAHRVDDLVAEGMSPEEARSRAAREFGDAARIRAESMAVRAEARRREARSSRMENARQDLAFAFRQLRHAPGFALTALLTLTLGVGATVTIASVVQAVVFEALPFADPGSVVEVEMRTPSDAPFSVAGPAFLDWQREARSFSGVGATTTRAGTVRSPGQPRSIQVAHVSHTLMEVLGVAPVAGRAFRSDEDLPSSAAPVAMISAAAWQSDFDSDPRVIGTDLDLDGVRHEIVGVMPGSLDLIFGDAPVFVPLGADPAADREEHDLAVYARLSQGVDLDAARAEMARLQPELSARYGSDVGWSAAVVSARDALIGDTVERAGWVLLVASGLLLLMACVNVSNLLMVRSTVRRSEMALRTALGASQSRLVRQLFTESALLALLGGALGVALAALALPLVRALGEAHIPRLSTASIDGPTLTAGLAAIALATLVCGLAPVLQQRGDRISSAMAPRGSEARRGGRVRSTLVAAQVAITVVLLAGTGLLLRSFVALSTVDPGFEAKGTLAFSIDMPDASWSWQERAELVPLIREAVASIPGVTAAGATAVEPFSGLALANFVAAEGRVPERASDFTPMQWRVVTPGFFEAMGMDVLEGRAFRDSDGWEEGTPVVIGRKLADALWSDGSAVGRGLVWGDPDGTRMTVVGVAEDLRDVSLGSEAPAIVYRPHRQIPWAVMTMVVRYEGDPAAIPAAIRERVAQTVPGLPVGDIRSLGETLRHAVAEPRFNLQILSGFAVAGLLLALVGVYGMTAFDVRRRFPEIGVRLSLGARPESVRRLILRRRMVPTFVGVAAGLVGAWFASRALGSLLYGVGPGDPWTWVGVVVVVVAASLAATWVPATRAMRVDPVEVLNGD